MVKRSRLFRDSDLKEIEKAVRQAEQGTSGEIVVLAVPSSGDYFSVRLAGALLGWAGASLTVWVAAALMNQELPLLRALEVQGIAMCLGALLVSIPAVLRAVLPKAWLREQIHRRCLASFTASGLHETRARTGILIYVSEMEHYVEILADRGIHEKVGPKYWDEQVQGIIRGIRDKRPGTAVASAVTALGEKLAAHFPRASDDANEIADHVRLSDPT